MVRPDRILLNICYLYRLIPWEGKLAWTRGMAYIFLGYCVAGRFMLRPLLLNSIAITGICMCAYSLNDFYDYRKRNERNYAGYLIAQNIYSERIVFICCLLPLLLCVSIFFIPSIISRLLLLLFLVVAVVYTVPPVSLKERGRWIYSPLCASIGFLEAYFVLGEYRRGIIFLGVLVFLFHLYAEMIHLLEEYQMKEITSVRIQQNALWGLKVLPYGAITFAGIFSVYNLFFLITIPFSLLRIYALKKVTRTSDFYAIHRNLWSAVYAPYEYISYAVLGMLGIFRI